MGDLLKEEGRGRKGLGVKGKFHSACDAFKVALKYPGGNLQQKIE